MGYGFDLQEWAGADEVRAWHDYMHAHLGWFHFLGGRAGGPTRGVDHTAYIAFNRPLDYAGYQHWQPTYEVYVAALETIPGKPVMSEDRFRIRGRSKDYTMEQTRRGLWNSAMAGGVANIWGHLRPEAEQGGSSPYPRPEWIHTYAAFFQRRWRADFVLDSSRSNGVCLRTPGRDRFIFYVEATNELTMDLRGMPERKPAVAVDALQPYEEIALGELEQETHTWRAPHASDWAVAVGAAWNERRPARELER
jgi:hypothetical protein